MKHILIIAILSVGMAALAQDDFVVIENPDLYDSDVCIWPQPGFTLIFGEILLVSSSCTGERPYAIPSSLIAPEQDKKRKRDIQPINWSLLKNKMIGSRREFRAYKSHIDLDVDWRSEKIAFYSNSTTYKFGVLDSDYLLMGISISEDGSILCLGFRSTFHGVCQGIAQQSEWYSHAFSTYAIIVPNTIEKIIRTYCHFGPDCSEVP